VVGGFYYRNPTTRSGVYSNDGGQSLLVGSLNGATCPSIALRNASGALIPYSVVNAQARALPSNCFTFLNSIPGGFTPNFGGEMEDRAITAGVKGVWAGDWHWDFSGTYGRNDIDFYIVNTVNASLGPNQPAGLRFSPGGNVQTERGVNFDIGHDFAAGFSSAPVSVAMGAEWREEEFEIIAGDPASTGIGPLTQQGFALGSNGFNGFNPRTAGSFARSNWAVYGDAETQFTEQLLLAAAVRYENFDDFGGTTNWKLTGRYDFTDAFAVRGALSTGFRAPTPGQSNAEQVTTSFIGGQLRDTAVLSPNNRIAAFYGAKSLKPEESKNASLGFVFNQDQWLVTADAYRIQTEGRLALSAFFTVTAADRAALVAGGNPEAASISEVQFFVNDFDTTTSGVDLVTSYDSELFGAKTTYSLAANWNRTEVDAFTPGIIIQRRIDQIEDSLPRTKGYFSINHQREVFNANVRVNYYGSFFEAHLDDNDALGNTTLPIHGDSAVTVDAEVGMKFASGLYFNLGAQNLFDKVPDVNPYAGIVGAKYPVHTPYGFNGGFYYARVGYKF